LPFRTGAKAALIAHGGAETELLEHALEGVEDLGPGAQRLREAGRALRDDHELLDIDGGVRMRAAVHDVHHGHRQDLGVGAADVAEEGEVEFVGRGVGHRQGHAQDGVGAQLGLGLGAVQLDHLAVDARLVEDVGADQGAADGAIDVGHRLLHALAEVALLVAVAQFDGLVLAGGGARGDGRAALRAGGQLHIDFYGRVAAGIENFAAQDVDDLRHGRLLFVVAINGAKVGERRRGFKRKWPETPFFIAPVRGAAMLRPWRIVSASSAGRSTRSTTVT
jgi:hypothetical protein